MKEDLLFGKIALLNNIITKEQLEEVIEIQKKAKPMRSLSFILRGKGYIKKNQIKAILQAQRKNLPRPVKSPEERKEDMAFGYIAFRNNYISIEDIVKCLKLQSDIAKKNLLFRLSEILVNEKYLTFSNIEEIIALQLEKILHCDKCSTPYNVVGLPAESRFPCRKCKNILEVSSNIADLDESEKLENYKRDIESGIREEQEKEKQLKATGKITPITSKEEVDDEEVIEPVSPKIENEKLDSSNIEQESVPQESETEISHQTDEDENEFVEEDSSILEVANENSLEENEVEPEYQEENEVEDYYELDEEFLQEETKIDPTSQTREIALDTDEIFAEEMPDLEEVTAKALAQTQSTYDDILKRKEAFEIITSDLSFLEDATTHSFDNFEIPSLSSLASFHEDDFFINEDDFIEETVYSDDAPIIKNHLANEKNSSSDSIEKIENSTLKIISDRFTFDSKLKIDSTDEDSIEALSDDETNKKKKQGKRKTSLFSFGKGKTNKPIRTRVASIQTKNIDDELDELSEDEVISVSPKSLKKIRNKK